MSEPEPSRSCCGPRRPSGSSGRRSRVTSAGWSPRAGSRSTTTRRCGAGRSTICEAFWGSIAEFFEVRFDSEPSAVLGSDVDARRRVVPGSGRSTTRSTSSAARTTTTLAVQFASESRPLDSWTWGELRAETASVAAGLRACGVGPGDRVAAYMPNIPETVAAFLACASIGAVWSSAAPEFGARSVIDRFAQIEPKVLLVVDGYRYGGKDFDRSASVDADHVGDAIAGAGRAAGVSRWHRLGGRASSGRRWRRVDV